MGWDAIHKMCSQAGVSNPHLLTASKQQHRISTMYAALEAPHFYTYMEHSGKTSQGIYPYPISILEMTKVGGG